MTRRKAGVTLIELMISLSLIAVVAGAVFPMLLDLRRGHDLAEGYAEDVRQVRSALRAVERDVRSADVVSAADGALRVTRSEREVVWRQDGDGLVRSATSGERRFRRVGSFSATVADGVARVVLAPSPRARPDARPPSVVSTVRPRGGSVR